MDPITIGLLVNFGRHLYKMSEEREKSIRVVKKVNATTKFFIEFDKNGNKELEADEIEAALQVHR
jgi:hypothetical protein